MPRGFEIYMVGPFSGFFFLFTLVQKESVTSHNAVFTASKDHYGPSMRQLTPIQE